VSVNRASGSYTNPATHVTILARPIDWTTAIGTGNATTHAFTPTAVTVTIAGGTLTITLAGDVLSVSGDITSLTIGSFISGSAHFELQKMTVSVDLNGDGTTDLTGATLLTVGITHANLTIGAAAGPHLQVTGASFALASLSAPAPAAGPAADHRSWTAIEGSID